MPNGQPFVTGTPSKATAPSITVPSIAKTPSGITTAVSSAAAASSSVSGSFDVARFRMAENASMAPVYNINVTGALDKEAVARQIVTILNESSARGSGGASALQLA
jgi:hypothetical protein